MPRGRPPLFQSSHQINVLVSGDEYRKLQLRVSEMRQRQPAFSLGDLVRSAIRLVLTDGRGQRATAAGPKANRIRQLHQLAAQASEIARELEGA